MKGTVKYGISLVLIAVFLVSLAGFSQLASGKVRAPPGVSPPSVVILAPQPGQEFDLGQAVLIQANVQSPFPISSVVAQATFPDQSQQLFPMVKVGGPNTWQVTFTPNGQRGLHTARIIAKGMWNLVNNTEVVSFYEWKTAYCTDSTTCTGALTVGSDNDKVVLTTGSPTANFDGTFITVGKDNVIFDGSRLSGVVIDGNDDFDTDIAIDMGGHSWVTVRNAEIKDFYVGVSGWDSQNADIHGMVIKSNQGNAIEWGSGNGFKVYDNKISGNLGYGIFGGSTSNNQIYSNNITSNSDWGMIFTNIQNSQIWNNDIAANINGGLRLGGTTSSGNTIYHNGFRDNNDGFNQVFAGPANTNNAWSNGYPSGGNYWSNFDEPLEGCNNAPAPPDLICDSPYTDPGTGATVTDSYPFVSMWAWL